MKSDRKPPLVKSPLRLRPRRVIRSGATPMRTPLLASSSKIRMQNQASNIKESSGIRPEYRTISCEIKALQSMVQEELGKSCSNGVGLGGFSATRSGSLFERGKFYDEYCAKRNERLKRKLSNPITDENEEPKTACNVGKLYDEYCAKRNERLKRKLSNPITDENEEPKTACNVGVAVESAKKEATKKRASVKKSIQETTATSHLADRSEHPRYALRNMKKPPLPVPMNVESSAGGCQRKTRIQRARRN